MSATSRSTTVVLKSPVADNDDDGGGREISKGGYKPVTFTAAVASIAVDSPAVAPAAARPAETVAIEPSSKSAAMPVSTASVSLDGALTGATEASAT